MSEPQTKLAFQTEAADRRTSKAGYLKGKWKYGTMEKWENGKMEKMEEKNIVILLSSTLKVRKIKVYLVLNLCKSSFFNICMDLFLN